MVEARRGGKKMLSPKDLELRDWLAGQALVGILMCPGTPRVGESPLEVHAASVAEQAYAYADALLEERGKPPETRRSDRV